MLPFITGAIWLYVSWRFVWSLPWGLAGRIGLALALLLVSHHHQITRRYFGSMASPEIPQEALIGLGWAFGAVLLLAMLLLLRDALGMLVFLAAPGAGRAILGGGALPQALGALAVALSAIGVWQAVRVPGVKTLEIALPGLPRAFDGYRIVQLTDLHISRLLPEAWTAAVVDKAKALDPDLMVLTGDLQDGTPEARAADVRPLGLLHARDGVLAIPGNHEYYADYRRWMAVLRELGLRMLENEHVILRRGDAALAVAGITDRQAGAFGQPGPDLQAALAGIPPGTATILLDHRPANAPLAAQAGVALQLSGHTHGGQILGAHVLTQWANGGYVSGLYAVGAMTLYLSNGTGLWNGLPIRLGRPSEITLIVLRAAER